MIFDPDELKDEEPKPEAILAPEETEPMDGARLTEPIDFRSLLNSLKAVTNSLPPSRERSLALTKLDEAGFWLGIARERITF